MVVEIDAAAEQAVDPRSARRLVPLELSEVTVPALSGVRGPVALFFRVLGKPDGTLRVELWERGEYHGSRTLSRAGENPQLVARRVALAAAELARRLARKREAAMAREARQARSRQARERELRERTQEGPVALRAELGYGEAPGKLRLFGQRLTTELTLRGRLRLDFGAESWGGSLKPGLGVELQGLSLAPAFRVALGRQLDLDGAVRAAALVLQAPSALSLDATKGENSSWTARADAGLRLQLRLTRFARASLGMEAGGLLRGVRYASSSGPGWLRGAWWGASLGLVITAPSAAAR